MKNCKSLHKCHVCQKPHHTLLHVEKTDSPSDSLNVSSNTVMKIRANALLMTCYVKVKSGLLSLLELSSIVPRLHRSSLNDWQEL